MRLLGFGAVVLSISMTLHMHRYMSRKSVSVTLMERKVSEVARRADEIGLLSSATKSFLRNEDRKIKQASLEPSISILDKKEVVMVTAAAPTFLKGNSTHPRIAYLTYLHLNGTAGIDRFENLIFPTLNTWHPLDEPYFVILADMWRSRYEELVATHANFTKFQNRLEIVFVDCVEGKTPESECCKQEEGMLYVMDRYDYDWLIYLDDDNYMRSSITRDYLTNLTTIEPLVLTSGPSTRMLGRYGYLPQKSSYKCSKDPSYLYPWGQVIAYNRATLAQIHKGLRMHGLLKQCLEYNVYHDVGNALFHWMYRIPEIRLRISDRPNEMRNEMLGSHGIGRCKFGCSMDQIHDWYNKPHYQPSKPYLIEWRNATGFQTTRTFRTHGCPSTWTNEWHTMPAADCLGPQ